MLYLKSAKITRLFNWLKASDFVKTTSFFQNNILRVYIFSHKPLKKLAYLEAQNRFQMDRMFDIFLNGDDEYFAILIEDNMIRLSNLLFTPFFNYFIVNFLVSLCVGINILLIC